MLKKLSYAGPFSKSLEKLCEMYEIVEESTNTSSTTPSTLSTQKTIHGKDKTKSSKFISELFSSIIDKDIALILEEPFMESDSKIKILWKDSEHLLLFRKFYAYHLSHLSSINSNENSLSSLMYNFDYFFNKIFHNLSVFFKNYNIDINRIVIRWFMTCFAEIMNVNQVT